MLFSKGGFRLTSKGKNEQWYTNKELYEMFKVEFKEIKQEFGSMKGELNATAQALKKHNGLHEEVSDICQRVTVLESVIDRDDRHEDINLAKETRSLKRWALIVAGLALLNIATPLIAAIL